MKTYAFHIQKGGVGKTTLAGNIGYALGMKGKTCIVDVDPQGNTTSWYVGKKFSPTSELADVLYGRVEVKDALLQLRDNLYLIPTFGLDGELKLYGENQLSNEPFVFDDLNEELGKQGFEYLVYDLSPGMSRLEKAVLITVDEVLTPMTPEFFSLDGIEIFANELKKLEKNMKRNIKHEKLIVNAVNETIKQHSDILASIPAGSFRVFKIPVDPSFRKSQALALSVFELNRKESAKHTTTTTINEIAEVLS